MALGRLRRKQGRREGRKGDGCERLNRTCLIACCYQNPWLIRRIGGGCGPRNAAFTWVWLPWVDVAAVGVALSRGRGPGATGCRRKGKPRLVVCDKI